MNKIPYNSGDEIHKMYHISVTTDDISYAHPSH